MNSAKLVIVAVAIAALAVAVQAGLTPDAASFLVNTLTAGRQRQPDVALAGDGRALVVWDSDIDVDGQIAGRIVDADGVARSGEFRISPSDTGSSHIRPVVAGFPSSGFVVAWENYIFDTDEDELLIQRVGPSGDLVGAEIVIDDSEFHFDADISIGAGGGFVVVWGDGFDILGRRFDASGGSLGGLFQVNDQLGTMYAPRVAAAADGAFAVVWEDRSSIDGDGDGILLRQFNPQGVPLGGDLQVNSTAEGDQYGAAIAMRSDGAFVVVWEAYAQTSLGDGAFGQAFSSSGQRVGGEFRVDSGESVYAGYVDAAAAGDEFVVLWSEPRDGSGEVLNTLMRTIDAGGTGGGIVDIDPDEEGDQAFGSLAGRGDAVMVAWQGIGPDAEDVFAQRFDLVDVTPTQTPDPLETPSAICPGDCDGSDSVSISELVRAVNIALGMIDVSMCTAADRNGDGNVAINELIAAVNSALSGCP